MKTLKYWERGEGNTLRAGALEDSVFYFDSIRVSNGVIALIIHADVDFVTATFDAAKVELKAR